MVERERKKEREREIKLIEPKKKVNHLKFNRIYIYVTEGRLRDLEDLVSH